MYVSNEKVEERLCYKTTKSAFGQAVKAVLLFPRRATRRWGKMNMV
jgi:hypothetical protein